MYIIEYADGATALVPDLQNVQLSHSDQTLLQRLTPGSSCVVEVVHDQDMMFTRVPDIILAPDGCKHHLGTAIRMLLSAHKGHEGRGLADRTNLRYVSVLD